MYLIYSELDTAYTQACQQQLKPFESQLITGSLHQLMHELIPEEQANLLNSSKPCYCALIFLLPRSQLMHLHFIQQLLTEQPLPILLHAQSCQKSQLKQLLRCGRISYVPHSLNPLRLGALVELAEIRFQQHQPRYLQQQWLAKQPILQLKFRLCQQGLSESDAHQQLQNFAMSHGMSLERAAQQLLNRLEAEHSPLYS